MSEQVRENLTLAEPRTSTEVWLGFGSGSESVLNPTPATLASVHKSRLAALTAHIRAERNSGPAVGAGTSLCGHARMCEAGAQNSARGCGNCIHEKSAPSTSLAASAFRATTLQGVGVQRRSGVRGRGEKEGGVACISVCPLPWSIGSVQGGVLNGAATNKEDHEAAGGIESDVGATASNAQIATFVGFPKPLVESGQTELNQKADKGAESDATVRAKRIQTEYQFASGVEHAGFQGIWPGIEREKWS
ncbi:hypothetical protein C8F04DRAFT_1198265 [Mycena alexandri]|uniref:Uncharacterized protein n=1 Tax=Mycena alexandri TaxID=1745969 RepID=A0AAD6WLR0_9AGAR|nr:hypothetical protein C8F04DRAFT_1198265 [Mycena alexandri]